MREQTPLSVPPMPELSMSSPWRRAVHRLLEQPGVVVVDIAQIEPHGPAKRVRVAVAAAVPTEDCPSYHVIVAKDPLDVGIYAQCSCPSRSVCKHVIAAVAVCGFGSRVGIPEAFTGQLLWERAHVRT